MTEQYELPGISREEARIAMRYGKRVFIERYFPVRFTISQAPAEDPKAPVPTYRIEVQVGRDILPNSIGVCEWQRECTLPWHELCESLGDRYNSYSFHYTQDEYALLHHGKTWERYADFLQEELMERMKQDASEGDREAQLLLALASEGFPTQGDFFRYVDSHTRDLQEDDEEGEGENNDEEEIERIPPF